MWQNQHREGNSVSKPTFSTDIMYRTCFSASSSPIFSPICNLFCSQITSYIHVSVVALSLKLSKKDYGSTIDYGKRLLYSQKFCLLHGRSEIREKNTSSLPFLVFSNGNYGIKKATVLTSIEATSNLLLQSYQKFQWGQ